MSLNLRKDIDRPLTYKEMDDNFIYLKSMIDIGGSGNYLGELADAPQNPEEGDWYKNTTTKTIERWNGVSWDIIVEDYTEGGGGPGGELMITRSLPNLLTDISNSALEKGATYKITGVHKAHTVEGMPIPALYDDGRDLGTTIYLTALSETELSSEGYGEFYNPKYLKSTPGYGIYNNSIYVTLYNIVGNFNFFNETVTAYNGATAKIISKNKLEYISGDWANATSSIIGDSSGSANIMSITAPSYKANDVVFWGGYAWQNLNGNIGVPTDVLDLGGEWSKIDYTDDDYYDKVLDRIEYDIKTDLILARYEVETNSFVRSSVRGVLNIFSNLGILPISVFQWGNSDKRNVQINDAIGVFVNLRGRMTNVSLDNGYMDNISLDNGYMDNISLDNGQMYNISLDNGGQMYNISLDNGGMNNISLDNGGYMNNISLDNGYMDNISLDNGYMDNISLDNGQMENVSLDNGWMENVSLDNDGRMNNVSFESFRADFQNVVYSNKTFENIKFIGRRGEIYTILDLNYNIAPTTIFDNENCLHKEVFDAGNGILNIRYWDVFAGEFAIVNITN